MTMKMLHASRPLPLAAVPPGRRVHFPIRTLSVISRASSSTTDKAPAQASWEAASALFSDESLRDLESLRARFAAADVDGSGAIDAEELRVVLESVEGGRACSLVHWLTDADVDTVLRAHDLDGDGKLSREEFERMATTDGLLLRGSLAEYEAAFAAADADGDGLVGATELADLLRALGRPVTYDELVAAMRDFDVDESGKLDFYESLRMFRAGGPERRARLLDLDEVLDYIRLTPTRRGAAEDAEEHERQRRRKAAAASAAAGRDGSAVSAAAAARGAVASPPDLDVDDKTATEKEDGAAAANNDNKGNLVTSVYSAAELDDLLAERAGAPTVLLASVTWCRPCRALARPYSLLAERYSPASGNLSDPTGVAFAKLYGNASDDAKALFRDRLKVRVTPTFFVFGAASPGEPTTVLHSHTGANKPKLEHAIREAIAARGGDVGGPPLYPPERKAAGGW